MMKRYDNFLNEEIYGGVKKCVSINIDEFKKTTNVFDRFLAYIYYNFEHELEARVSQTYEYYRIFKKGSDFKDAWQDFLSKELYGMLKYLNGFDHIKFIKSWNKYVLLDFTNQFNIIYGLDQIKLSQLNDYYKKWEKLFKNNYKIYLEKSKDAVTDSINNIQKYESNAMMCYDETPLYENHSININDKMKKIIEKYIKIEL